MNPDALAWSRRFAARHGGRTPDDDPRPELQRHAPIVLPGGGSRIGTDDNRPGRGLAAPAPLR